jgi:hypothetical protein
MVCGKFVAGGQARSIPSGGWKSFIDGTLYRARVQRSDGAQFLANGKPVKVWETPQSMDAESAIGQALYAIDTGKIK